MGRSLLIPRYMFLTKGVGFHKDKLNSFEDSLRNAGIEKFNLVTVSSILPPACKIISKNRGLSLLQPGAVIYCVMSRLDSNEPNRLLSSAIGVAVPADRDKAYGYISEHHAYGQTASVAGDYAEDLAAQMIGTTLGIEVDPDQAWDERKQVYLASGRIFQTRNICQSCRVPKDGRWATVIATAVFVI
ncbi:arginine decarboxylase, pyruvoyl-dependent [bacterium]|nr:arginine decarboxylase, pyruvoyl-dependent [candidate division CSSED10-310 bacterium]